MCCYEEGIARRGILVISMEGCLRSIQEGSRAHRKEEVNLFMGGVYKEDPANRR